MSKMVKQLGIGALLLTALQSSTALAQQDSIEVNVITLSGAPVSDVLVEAYQGNEPTGIGNFTNLGRGAEVSLPAGGYRFRLLVDDKEFYTKANNHCLTSTCESITYVLPPAISGSKNSNSDPTLVDLTIGADNLPASNAPSPSPTYASSTQAMMGEGGLILTVPNPDAPAVNLFGFAIAEQTPTEELIASALNYDPVLDEYNGHVYLVDLDTQTDILDITSPNATADAFFGWTVASLSNGDIVVSDFAEAIGGVPAGAVYVFDGTTGALKVTIANPNPSADDQFGYAVEVTTNDYIAIGAPKEGTGGAVYVYNASGVLQQTIVNPTIDAGADFGRSIASNSFGELVIGAPVQHVTVGPTTYFAAGAVYQYTELTGVQQLAIDNPNPADADLYGQVVATLSTDEIVVSSIFYDSATTDDGYLFVHDEQTGQLIWGLPNPIADFEGWFANTLVGTPDGNLLVGATRNDLGANDAGRVFVFDDSGNLIKTLDNPSPSTGEEFGKGLAVASNSVIGVGAYFGQGFAGEVYFYSPVVVGDNLTLLNDLTFADPNLASCVQSEAAANGWALVSETTTLDCSGLGIVDLTGLSELTELTSLDISGNTGMICDDLDSIEITLAGTTITRPASCIQEAPIENLHNALGQRVAKTVNGNLNTAVHFIYDQAGRVIAEIDAATGTTTREYIYVNGVQVALVDDTDTVDEEVYFVHNDHLGTPQKITDDSQTVVWGASYDPFGEVTETVSTIENNIRFPGQYEDGETGLSYNYFRDYDASLGRYIQSDPIGLAGGLNTYGYAYQNPIIYTDPYGLTPATAAQGAGIGGAVGGPPGAVVGGVIGFGLGLVLADAIGDAIKDNSQDRNIDQPDKPRRGVTCTCRAASSGQQEGNCPEDEFAFGTATAPTYSQARAEAERIARRKLGKQAKHTQCKCTDNNGNRMF